MAHKLSKYVKEGHGKQTEKTLDLHADRADRADRAERRYQNDHELHKVYHRAGDMNKAAYFAETRDHAADKAQKYAEMSDDTHRAKHLVKTYGAGRDMAHHSEGKPYGDKV